IADVSYYVRANTPLDEEAMRRGTSIYYANKVVPMLPKELSNGICSLNPNAERLAFSAIMTLSKDGKLMGYEFKKTVICSRVKGVYAEVNEILNGTADDSILKKYKDVLSMIPLMKELKDILGHNRKVRGAPDIDTAESKLILDENDWIIDIVPRKRGEAELIIEEFMLTANEAAATLAKKQEIPFVYRVHEFPDQDRLTTLHETLQALGIPTKEMVGDVPAKVLSDILDEAKGKPCYPIVSRQVLRSMAKAKYCELPLGHYGLVLENYAQFTSPIRRYPDLTIHRILSDLVTKNRTIPEIKKTYGEYVKTSAAHSSATEIAAVRVERDCEDCYKAEYMESHIGETFDGLIASATSFGFYVSLANTVDGLVRAESLPDGQYQFDGLMEFKEIKKPNNGIRSHKKAPNVFSVWCFLSSIGL
ncbi:MAG: VacB/RNase II family 3'-5' exoribonuclease, partial [Oscillospiraceae bacterium]